jgi:hypothetical protein
MTQKEYFKTANTRELLTFRRRATFRFPRFVGDKDLGYDYDGSFMGYKIDRVALFDQNVLMSPQEKKLNF